MGPNAWAAAAAEQPPGSRNRVIPDVPYATLTDMTRLAMAHIWSAIDSAANGDVVPVGAVPAVP